MAENNNPLDGLGKFFDSVLSYADNALDKVNPIITKWNAVSNSAQQTTQSQPVQQNPTYTSNWSWDDFKFTPYYPLLIGGFVLLVIALVLKFLKK